MIVDAWIVKRIEKPLPECIKISDQYPHDSMRQIFEQTFERSRIKNNRHISAISDLDLMDLYRK